VGQKINPHGMRVGINKNWSSRWFANSKDFASMLVQDNVLRAFIKKKIYNTGIPKVEIERSGVKVRAFIHCAKPGLVIGRAGAGIEKLRSECENLIKKPVVLSIVEIRRPDSNSQLLAEFVSQQLEKRISFRRAVKQAIGRAMKSGVRGVKIQVSGRLGGAEIARTEHYNEGSIPLQTIRADIDYGFSEASTTYGIIGVKVWLYKGEIFKGNRGSPENKGGEANAVAKKNKA
jgi:small subunit ribosomal protein S3